MIPQLCRSSLLVIALVMAGLAAAQVAPTAQQKLASLRGEGDAVLRAYLRQQQAWAKQHEAEGDAFRAQGDVAAALTAYQHAIAEVGAGTASIAWTLEQVRDGQRVTEVVAGKRAALAGVQVGDILLAADGVPVAGLDDMRLRILLYMIDAVPVRPHRITLRRGAGTLEAAIERVPTFKAIFNADELAYREALVQKVERFIVESRQLPVVTDNMRSAARRLQEDLRDARGEDVQYAREDMRGGAYAMLGWADYALNCGLLLEAAGDAIEAEKCFRSFLLVRPDDPQAPAVAARFASLAPMLRAEQDLKAWEGAWRITKEGQGTDRGYWFTRNGKLLEVKNHRDELWLSGAITDEFHADALQYITAEATGGALGQLIARCFSGRMEAAGTMQLSPDKQRLTLTVSNDVDVDSKTCAIVRRNSSVQTYVR